MRFTELGMGERLRWCYPITGLAIGFFLLISLSYSALYPYLMDYYGIDTVTPLALGCSIEGLASMLIGPFVAGFVIDRYGPKAAYGICMIFTAAALLIVRYMLTIPTWEDAAIFYYLFGFVSGFGAAHYSATNTSVTAKWFPDKVGIALGIALIGPGSAGIWFGQMIPFLADKIGLDGMFTILYAIAVFVVFVLGFMLWRAPDEGWTPKGKKLEVKADTAQLQGMDLKQATKTPDFWILFTCITCATIPIFAFLGNISTLVISGLVDEGGNAMSEVVGAGGILATVMTIGSVVNTASRPLWGMITDKISRPWKVMIASYFGLMLAMVLLCQIYTTPIGAGIGVCCVFFFCAVSPLHQACPVVVFGPKHAGKIMGTMLVAVGIANFAGPVLGSSIFDFTGDYFYTVLACCAFLLVSVCLASWLLVRMNKREKEFNNTATE